MDLTQQLAARLSRPEAGALELVDQRAPEMLAQVEQWSAINSGSRNLEGLALMSEVLARAIEGLDGTLRFREPAPVEAIDAGGRRRPVSHGRNIHWTKRPDAPFQVLLVGHMDTVFGTDHPFQSTRWVEPNKLNGPGVADMKGGIAVMLAALTALENSPFAAAIGLEVIINADEEVSSLGSAPLLEEAARRCDVGLCFEPSLLPDGTLAGARKGDGTFSVILRGRAAHAGRNPQDGRNAIVAAAELAVVLAALPASREGITINPARIDGGGATNVVPDLAVLRLDVRINTVDDQLWVEESVHRAMGDISRKHGVEADLHGGFTRPPKPLDSHQAKLFDLVKSCGGDLGLDLRWRPSGGVCDGNNLAAQGLPVVDTLGVRGGAIHSPDEFMLTESLAERAKLSALVLMRLAQGAWDRR